MPEKIFITGNSGTGKTTVVAELAARGYTAYSTEEMPGYNLHFDMVTNKVVPRPPSPIDYGRYMNIWDRDKLQELLKSDELVFIADLNTTQHEYYSLFDKIILLTADEDTIKYRLKTRTSNVDDFGKHPEELKAVLEYRPIFDAETKANSKTTTIDSTQPLTKVVDTIISIAMNDNR